ncbi:glycoside hydrolase family 43 protein [Formosa sp. S-31]|uniref:glycoside hydrolase family 43 protein n=1 Tax=Formosa sp. S-31 TaxID=2790949 RepID=UPI003EBE990E
MTIKKHLLLPAIFITIFSLSFLKAEGQTLSSSISKQDSILLFSYFKGNGEDGLHLAFSTDGYTFKALNNDKSILTPEIGPNKLMRDPCIISGPDQTFHMVWTTGWTDKGIGYSSSEDLVHWTKQQYIPVMEHEPEARNCWAPELTYDPTSNQFIIYWATTITGTFPETQTDADKGYNHRMYYVTTKDFSSFSKTKLLYDGGFNVIDATIQKENNSYIMFLKDETKAPKPEKNLRIATSSSLIGPYSKASNPITGNYWAEGPTAVKFNGNWMVYFDKYTEHQYGAVRSKNLKDWEDVSDKIVFPKGTRHGTIIRVSNLVFQNIQKELNK